MKVWYDACTGKHVRYASTLARRLRMHGHKFLFTTRTHPDTLALAKLLGEDPIVVGKYSPRSLCSRIEESAFRMKKLARLICAESPDVSVSHQSPDSCRVAFGLGVPVITTADTPRAEAVNRLTVPLSSVLVISEAIPEKVYRTYGAREIESFRGVDEYAWVKDLRPLSKRDRSQPLIVVRQIETKASYALGEEDATRTVAEKLSALGKVVFLPRYERREDEPVDSVDLAGSADLVVSAGGTMSREAALQGVPSIVISRIGKTQVNEYLSRLGFPLFIVEPKDALDCAERVIGKRYDVKSKLKTFEDPIEIIENACLRLSKKTVEG